MRKPQFLRDVKQELSFNIVNNWTYWYQTRPWWKAATTRLLLISDNINYTSEQQFAPLYANRKLILNELDVAFNHQLLKTAIKFSSADLAQYTHIGLKLSFRTPPAEAQKILEHFYERKGNAHLIFFDGDDDACVQFQSALPLVDQYVKKHLFASNDAYLCDYVGKNNLTDYVHRTKGLDLSNHIVASFDALRPDQLSKLVCGWNIALDDKIRQLANLATPVSNDQKTVVATCRATSSPDLWISALRQPAIQQLEALKRNWVVECASQRVSQKQYNDELRRSQMCVSPLGFGEICWRDFEAVLFRCLLIKPNMDHLTTWPNIYVPYKTYVPVLWDYSDLEEKVAYYSAHPEERMEIVNNAYQVLVKSLQPEEFLARLRQVLNIKKTSLAENKHV